MRRGVAALTATVAIASLLAACGTNKQTTVDKPTSGIPSGPIVIGMPIALTGPINAFDGNTELGAQLSAAAINSAGGVDGHQIKIVTADTASSIAEGTTAAQQVVSQGARFIIPTIDYNYGGGAARVGQSHNDIVLGAADDTRFGLSLGSNVYNLDTGGPTGGAVLAEYAHTTLKWHKAYVLEDSSIAAAAAACDGFSESFGLLGGSSTRDTFQEDTQSSVVSAVSRVRSAASGVDGIVLCGHPPAGATVIRQLRAAGVRKPLELSAGFDGNFWESAAPDLSNTYTVSFGPVTPGQDEQNAPAQAAFAAAQKAGKSVTYSLGFLTGYSAVQAIADAVKATNSTSADKIRPYLDSYQNHSLAIGPTTWTSTCHARPGNPLIIADFRGGKEYYVTTVTPSKLPDHDC